MVIVDFLELPTIVAGLNPQEAPVGKPAQESTTELLKPNVGMTDTVEVAEFPAVAGVGETALAETSKPAGFVFSSTPNPLPHPKTMSGRRSRFMSAIACAYNSPFAGTLMGGPKVPSPFPKRTVTAFPLEPS